MQSFQISDHMIPCVIKFLNPQINNYMKKFIVLALIFCAQLTYAQTDENYQEVISKITENFNSQNAEGIHSLFSADYKTSFTLDKLKGFIETTQAAKGNIDDASLLMKDETGVRFLIQFAEASSVFVLHLNSDGLLTNFELEEY